MEDDLIVYPVDAMKKMYELVRLYTDMAKYMGDAVYEYSYDLSISWGSPTAKDFESTLTVMTHFVRDSLNTVNEFIDIYEEGLNLLLGVENMEITFPRADIPELETVSMHDNIDGKVGVDIEYATAATEKYMDRCDRFAVIGGHPPLPIGIEDEELEAELLEMYTGAVDGALEVNQYSREGMIYRLENEIGRVSVSETMSYEDLMASVEKIEDDEIPDNLKPYKVWLNSKAGIDEYAANFKQVALGPYADEFDESEIIPIEKRVVEGYPLPSDEENTEQSNDDESGSESTEKTEE